MASGMRVMHKAHLTLVDGQFSQHHTRKRIKEIRVYSPQDIEIVDGDSKTVRIQQEFFHFPSFSKPEQFSAYLSSVYWTVNHLENGDYRIFTRVRCKGGGAETSSLAPDKLNSQEKARLEKLLQRVVQKYRLEDPKDNALIFSIQWALNICYELGGRKRKTQPTFKNWLGEPFSINNALEDAKKDILILLKARASAQECLNIAYTYHLSEDRVDRWASDFKPRDASYRNSVEEEFQIWLIQTAEENGSTMGTTILCEYYSAANSRPDLMRRWVDTVEPEMLDEELLVWFFRYTKAKDRSIEEKMIRLVVRTTARIKDFLFERFFLEEHPVDFRHDLALSMLNHDYRYTNLNRAAALAIERCINSSTPVNNLTLKALFGAKPTQESHGQGELADCIEIVRRIAPNPPIDPNAKFLSNDEGPMAPLDLAVKKDAAQLVKVLTEVGARKTTKMLLDAIDQRNASSYFQLLMQADGEIDLNAVKAKLSDSLAKLCEQNVWMSLDLKKLAFLLLSGAGYTRMSSRVYRLLPSAIRVILNNEFKEEKNFVALVQTTRQMCILHLKNDQYQKLEQKNAVAAFINLVDRMLLDSCIILGLHQADDAEVALLQKEFSTFLAEKLSNILEKTSLAFTGDQLNEETFKNLVAPEFIVWAATNRRKLGPENEDTAEYQRRIFIEFESQKQIVREQKKNDVRTIKSFRTSSTIVAEANQ